MRRDTTRQIPHSKLPCPIYDVLTQSSNVQPHYTDWTLRPADILQALRRRREDTFLNKVVIFIFFAYKSILVAS